MTIFSSVGNAYELSTLKPMLQIVGWQAQLVLIEYALSTRMMYAWYWYSYE